MDLKNPHLGSNFNEWLEEEDIHDEVIAAAIKAVIAMKLAEALKADKTTESSAVVVEQPGNPVDSARGPYHR